MEILRSRQTIAYKSGQHHRYQWVKKVFGPNKSRQLTNFMSVGLSPQLTGILRFCIFEILFSHRYLINWIISRGLLLLFRQLPVLVHNTVQRHWVVIIHVGTERSSWGRGLDIMSIAIIRALVIAHRWRWVYKVSAVAVGEVVLLQIKNKNVNKSRRGDIFVTYLMTLLMVQDWVVIQ